MFEPRLCGICGGQSGTGAGFLRVLRFLLSIVIPPTASHSSSIIRGWYNRPVSGRYTKRTQVSCHAKKLKKKLLHINLGSIPGRGNIFHYVQTTFVSSDFESLLFLDQSCWGIYTVAYPHQNTDIMNTWIFFLLRGFSPPANYADRATTACQRS
jgi:hypothetical protein